MTKVTNRRQGWAPGGVDIGRSSRWGNRISYVDHKVATRADFQAAVAEYRRWAMAPARAAWRGEVRALLRGKTLVCWCKPMPCHGDVLAEIADSEV